MIMDPAPAGPPTRPPTGGAVGASGAAALPVLLILIVGCGLAGLLGAAVRDARAADRVATFRADAEVRIRLVTEAVQLLHNDLFALQALYRASDRVEVGEFETFAKTLLAHGGARVYEWAPRVGAADRAAYEAAGTPIVERVDGAVLPARAREEYFPVTWVVPRVGNERAFGFDVGAEPARRAALQAARLRAGPASSAPVELAQGGRGFVTFAPVFPDGDPGMEPLGFVLGVSRGADLLASVLSVLPEGTAVLTLTDPRAPPEEALIGRYPADTPATVTGPRVEASIDVGGHSWTVLAVPTTVWAERGERDVAAGVAFLAGIGLTVLLAGYVRLLGEGAARARADAQRLDREVGERRRAEQDARQAEAKFRVLAEEAGVGVYLLQDGVFRYVNPRFAELFDRAPAELVDRLGPGDLVPGEGAAAERVLAAIGGRQRRELALGPEPERVVAVYASPTSLSGRPAVLGTVVDLGAERRLAAAQNRVERLEALGELAGGIAHDFNNLLTVISGNLALAELDTEPDTEVAIRLAQATLAVGRAQGLTTQLQTFSRGGAPILAPTDLGAVVRETAGFALRGASVRAEVEVASGLWPVEADASQLSRVVQNLVLNASQAMPEGGVVQVEVQNEHLGEGGPLPPGRYVRLRVRDHGRGIAPEHLDRIFDPYFTTRPGGSGLGLASAHSIVLRHRGGIEVSSVVGEGSTFTVRLPAGDRAPDVVGGRGVLPTSAGRVLVMDDEAGVREVATLLLRSLGYAAESCEDGALAVAAYRRALDADQPFDVVILDLTVPGGMGGVATLAELRRIDPGVKAIASSGYSADAVLANPDHGFTALLPKPYLREDLHAVLRGALGDGPTRPGLPLS